MIDLRVRTCGKRQNSTPYPNHRLCKALPRRSTPTHLRHISPFKNALHYQHCATHSPPPFVLQFPHMLIGYARVSTEDQTTRLQTDALKAAGCEKIFEEKASGVSTERPQLTRLLELLRKGDVLVVWRLDRLGRNLPHLIETVQRLVDNKIGFRSLSESLDTTTSGGRFIFNVFGSLAQFERDIISERTRAGLAAARARGRFGGRKPKITPEKLKTARTLLRDPDHTIKDAATAIGVHYVTLWRGLKRTDATATESSKIATTPARPKSRKRSRTVRKKRRL